MRKALFFLVMLMFVFAGSALAEQDIQVKVNGEVIEFPDQQPVINSDNRTLVPVRFISEALGANVEWDGNLKTVFITKDDDKISLVIGERAATKNGETLTFDTAASIINERTMVPLRFVSEALGAKVEWDGATKTVLITTGETDVVKERLTIDINNLEQDPDLPEGVLNKQQHWALDDRVIETLKIEDGKLKGYLPELPDGFYYNLIYAGTDNLGNKHQVLIFEQAGEHFEVDISNDQSGGLSIMIYSEKINAALGSSGVLIPSGVIMRDGEKVGEINLEK